MAQFRVTFTYSLALAASPRRITPPMLAVIAISGLLICSAGAFALVHRTRQIAFGAWHVSRCGKQTYHVLGRQVCSGAGCDLSMFSPSRKHATRPLIDGRYKLTVNSNAVENSYDNLDGDNNGYGGPDYVLDSTGVTGIFRLFGDGDGSAAVVAVDFNLFRLVYGLSDPQVTFPFDYNGDGICNAIDYNQFRLRYGVTI